MERATSVLLDELRQIDDKVMKMMEEANQIIAMTHRLRSRIIRGETTGVLKDLNTALDNWEPTLDEND